MKQKRILSVQDISCFGKCSSTVALPVLSAADVETVILPTALLSTHTGGFENFTFLDLTEEMGRILSHWKSLGMQFDMIYTGYFGSAEQLTLVEEYLTPLLSPGGTVLVDPVMGDRGQLYSIYDGAFVDAMRDFCRRADLITPNVTEACLLSGVPYAGDSYRPDYMEAILAGLGRVGCGAAAVTGVHFGEEQIGVVYRDFRRGERATLAAPRSDAPLHGTGDVFASALAAFLLGGFPVRQALARTVSFVSDCIRDTEDDLEGHWYGLKFEGRLSMITDGVREIRFAEALRREREAEADELGSRAPAGEHGEAKDTAP